MFVLNAGRYIVGDPEKILDSATFKRLWGAGTTLNALYLATPFGAIIAPRTGSGTFATDRGKFLPTATGHIAFVPYQAAGRLLPADIIRICLQTASILYFSDNSNIILDGILTIFCGHSQHSASKSR